MIPIRVKDFIRYFFGYIVVWIVAVYIFTFIRLFGMTDALRLTQELDLNLLDSFSEITLFGLILGIMFILTDFILKNEWVKKHSYFTIIVIAIVLHSITFYVTIFFVVLFLEPLYQGVSTSQLVYAVFTSGNMWVAFFYFNLVIILLNLERYVRKIFGPGVMIDIIRGKYYKPRNEERVFMFLDLISSTTYAEKLGSLRFTELIQDCFYDVSSIVKRHDAEIYQYVGDEVILMWHKNRASWKNNAFQSYFSFIDLLRRKSDYYLTKYGILPEFKAGMHFGIASVGEVGGIKKEIAYLGDAVNVAARLLGMCNKYGKSFLVSEEMKELASLNKQFQFEFLAEEILKGRQSPTKIYSVEIKD